MSGKSHFLKERRKNKTKIKEKRTMPRTMCKKAISSGSEVIYRVWKLVSIFLQRKWSELYHHAWNIPMFSVNSSHLFLSSENNCNVFLRKDIKDAKRGDSAIESKS